MIFNSYDMAGVRIALDLVNRLLPGTMHGRPFEGDATLAALREILESDPESTASVQAADVEPFRNLARRLRVAIESIEENELDKAAEDLNGILQEHPATPVLERGTDGLWRLHHHPLDAALVPMWAAICAEGVARQIGEQNASRFGLCRASACDRAFFDTSRNGRRRFCSLACQNRTKAAMFRARNK